MFHQTKRKARFCLWNQKQSNVIMACFSTFGQRLNQMSSYSGIVVQSGISPAGDA
jgi:hypothetical protein